MQDNRFDAPTPKVLRAQYLSVLQDEAATLRDASDTTSQDRRPVTLDQQSVGRLSRMDAIQQQAMANATEARRHARLRAIDAALRRVIGEDFGWCDDCGDFIGTERLDLDPTLTRCISCAS